LFSCLVHEHCQTARSPIRGGSRGAAALLSSSRANDRTWTMSETVTKVSTFWTDALAGSRHHHAERRW
jgi:hypothetical protein